LAERRPRQLVIGCDELLKHSHEPAALFGLQWGKHAVLGAFDGRGDISQEFLRRSRQPQHLDAPIVGTRQAQHQPLRFQTFENIPQGRAVEGDQSRKAGGVDARMLANGDQRGILHGRQVEGRAFVHVDRNGDLLHAPKHVPRLGIDLIHRHRSPLTCPSGRARCASNLTLRRAIAVKLRLSFLHAPRQRLTDYCYSVCCQ
jgi:hypothetical protein